MLLLATLPHSKRIGKKIFNIYANVINQNNWDEKREGKISVCLKVERSVWNTPICNINCTSMNQPICLLYLQCKLILVQIYRWKILRSTNPETHKARLFISNWFWAALRLALSVAQQPIRGQLKIITGLWGARICTS